jgi:p24 family protein alpha
MQRRFSQEVESGHSVVSTRGPPEGRFTFTSHDAGDHSICLSTSYSSSWFGPTAHIRLYFDVAVGSTKPNVDHDRSHVSVLSGRLRDLNIKIEDIRREQQYQRERESDFRDLSEVTNSRAVWYSIAQILVLLTTCVWQLRHLRVSTISPSCLPLNVTDGLTNLSDSLRIERCTSVQLHVIYLFRIHYAGTW